MAALVGAKVEEDRTQTLCQSVEKNGGFILLHNPVARGYP